MPIAAHISNLNIYFKEQHILHNINVDIPNLGITVLLGRSGSGKTTFLRTLNRLNDEFPDYKVEGEVLLDLGAGLENIHNVPSLADLRLKAGMLFQTPNVLPVSIERNIAMPLKLLTKLSASSIKDKVKKCLEDVGLWQQVYNRLNQQADLLSGGQQQRLCLARTLALDPKILLLDEPTSSLDTLAAREIELLLLHLAKQYTIIMVSHSLAQARRMANRILIFNSGKIAHALHNEDEWREEKLLKLMEDFL